MNQRLVKKDWVPYENTELMHYDGTILQKFLKLRWTIANPLRYLVLLRPIPITLGEVLIALPLIAILVVAFLTGGVSGTGSVAQVPIGLAFATAAHHSPSNFLLGLHLERRLFVHKACAYLTIITGGWHAIKYYIKGDADHGGDVVTGWVALGSFIALPISAFYLVRIRWFNLFYFSHIFFFVLAFLFCLLHGAGSVVIGVGFWGVDILMRYGLDQWRGKRTGEFSCLPGNVVKVVFPAKGLRYTAGQYIFFCVPEINYFEWHPFSISSAPGDGENVSIHIRSLGDWTERLYKLIDDKQKARFGHSCKLYFFLEGPYGEPVVDVWGGRYKNFLLVSGGIGITPLQSVARELMSQQQRGRDVDRIWFCWSVRDRLVEAFDISTPPEAAEIPTVFQPNLLGATSEELKEKTQSPLYAQFYLTGDAINGDTELGPTTGRNVHKGRMNCERVLKDMAAAIPRDKQGGPAERVAVMFCGPVGMGHDLQEAAHRVSDANVAFEFHSEVFAF